MVAIRFNRARHTREARTVNMFTFGPRPSEAALGNVCENWANGWDAAALTLAGTDRRAPDDGETS